MDKPIPEGYWRDARGSLVPVDLIKPIDKQRDQLVREIVASAQTLSKLLTDFKGRSFGDIEAFVDLSLQEYGTKLGGKKGNVTLATFDGQYKVLRANADNINFDERIQAAKELIDECVVEWSDGARPEIKAIIEHAFAVDKQGKISIGRVLNLRRLDIKDPRWLKAMDSISDSLHVIGCTSYIRIYERVGDSEKYVPIPLDMAAVRL
jgi:hypothetical protein